MKLLVKTLCTWIPALAILWVQVLENNGWNLVGRMKSALHISGPFHIWVDMGLLFAVSFTVALVTAYFTDRFIPTATNRKEAARFALPSLLVHGLFYSVKLFQILDDPGRVGLDDVVYGVVLFSKYIFSQSVLLAGTVAVFAWLGTRAAEKWRPT